MRFLLDECDINVPDYFSGYEKYSSVRCRLAKKKQTDDTVHILLRVPNRVPEKYQDYNLYISRIGIVWQRIDDFPNGSEHWKINTQKFTIDNRAYIEYEHASGEIERIYVDELFLLTFGDKAHRERYHKCQCPTVIHRNNKLWDLTLKRLTWCDETVLPKTNMVKLIAKTKGVISLFLD